MTNKIMIVNIFFLLLFSLSFSYGLAFGFNDNVKVNFKLSNNVYLDSLNLKHTKVAFISNVDLKNYKVI
jgi:hypothetical protein